MEDAAEERAASEIAAEDHQGIRPAPLDAIDHRLQPCHTPAFAMAVGHGSDLVGVGDVEQRGFRSGAAGPRAHGEREHEGELEGLRARGRVITRHETSAAYFFSASTSGSSMKLAFVGEW
ncbi:MAG: hypothetical protein ABIT01_09145 [Thermoanaerobaculia bacterium]